MFAHHLTLNPILYEHCTRKPVPPGRALIKQVSNDLDRLSRMHFLNRSREKRLVRTRSGTKCFRGYQHKYRLSKTGNSYLGYLLNPEAAHGRSRAERTTAEVIGKNMIRSRFPMLKDALDLWEREYPADGRKGYNRFQNKLRNRELLEKYLDARVLLSEVGIDFNRINERVSLVQDYVLMLNENANELPYSRLLDAMQKPNEGNNRQIQLVLKTLADRELFHLASGYRLFDH